MNQKTQQFNQKDQQVLKNWKRIKQIKNSTFKSYTSQIKHYTKATNMTLHELYEEAIQEEEQRIPKHRKSIKTHLLEFYDYLDDQNLSENTKNGYVYVVRSLYESMDIELPNIPNNYDATPDPRNTEKMITKDIIKIMLHNASTRDKAIISFAATTGQSPNEICHIRIEDLIKCWNTELEHPLFDLPDIFKYKNEILSLKAPMMKIKRLKTSTNYWFYLPSETSMYIIEYLYERVAGRNENIRIHSKNDILFLSQYGEPCTANALAKVFTYVGKRCGFERPELFDEKTRLLLEREEGTQRIYCAYKFRKYFTNTCRRYAGTRPETDTEHIYTGKELGDFWIGHKEKGSLSSYIQYNDEDVLELQKHYLQMLPYLSLEMEVDTVTTKDKEELNKMKEKYDEILQEMEELKEYVRQKQHFHDLAREYGFE